jgi:hypothetical protein
MIIGITPIWNNNAPILIQKINDFLILKTIFSLFTISIKNKISVITNKVEPKTILFAKKLFIKLVLSIIISNNVNNKYEPKKIFIKVLFFLFLNKDL